MPPTKICRAWVEADEVRAEIAPGVAYRLPPPEGKTYDPRKALLAVTAAGAINIDRWEKLNAHN